MNNDPAHYPKQRTASMSEWSPSVHYAQFQHMPAGILPERRLYDFELLYVCHGEAATRMQGQHYILEAGQLILLPSGVYHQNEVIAAAGVRFLGIHFDFFNELDIQTEADMVVNELSVWPDKFCFEAVAEGQAHLTEHPVYTPPLACVQLMEQLVEEFTKRALGYELVCKGLMLNILAYLLRTPLSRTLTQATLHGRRLAALMERIEAAPATSWSNTAIAEQMNMSVDHAAKLFKQMAGMPPSEFVQSVRHREARRLLRESDLSIEIVGDHVGYSDIHYFSRIFRRHEGISPREYRKLSKIL
ncbi:AraC-like DNA-binding protein [Paenibacillus endophyticus]|uniref:AraC-like DNA-binding protein n=1 Tax=Paenibacillus endophyticus TaxID=1294268 RepID=A0A7W5C553_9BACL|nr:AraC family transcriptional regulator [Paenibacillus endophyticus]MBB3151368.1 AraC-like DNA-binding protein [Paenibacillus endophyticus]